MAAEFYDQDNDPLYPIDNSISNKISLILQASLLVLLLCFVLFMFVGILGLLAYLMVPQFKEFVDTVISG